MTGCLRCGRCCTQFGVCITLFDIKRIADATGKAPMHFISLIDDYENRERKEPAIIIDGKPMLLVLKRDAKEVCCFYSGNGCAAYENRPMLCRCYPFVLQNGKLIELKSRACQKKWVLDDDEKAQYERDASQYEKELAAYKRIADEWNKRGGSLNGFIRFSLAHLDAIYP
jgi:Fe-S-cluster containining protein